MTKYPFLDAGAVVELLRPFYPAADRELAGRVLIYLELLFNWNRKINLTAVKTPVQAITKHFGESFFSATIFPMNRGVLVDVGSGAGFPGLALKLVCPELEVILLEPSLKKCAFLAEVTRTLKLGGVQILSERLERAFSDQPIADFVTFRAVGEQEALLLWSRRILKPEGKVIAWLGANDAQRLSALRDWVISKSTKIPGQSESFIVVMQPS